MNKDAIAAMQWTALNFMFSMNHSFKIFVDPEKSQPPVY